MPLTGNVQMPVENEERPRDDDHAMVQDPEEEPDPHAEYPGFDAAVRDLSPGLW